MTVKALCVMAIDLSGDLVGNFKSQRSHFDPTLGLSQRN